MNRQESKRKATERPTSAQPPPPNSTHAPINANVTRRIKTILSNLHSDFLAIGMEPTLSIKKIKAGFRQRALLTHPDKPGGSAELFRAAKESADKIETLVIDQLKRFPEIDLDSRHQCHEQ